MEEKKYEETFEQDLEMLKYFQDEFKFRQEHYWDILIKLFIFTITITILPIASEVFGIKLNEIDPRFLVCFPALGLVVAFFGFFLISKEAKKMSAVNHAKYRINRGMDSKYHYHFYNKDVGTEKSDQKKFLSFQMAWFVLILELIVIASVTAVIISSFHAVAS